MIDPSAPEPQTPSEAELSVPFNPGSPHAKAAVAEGRPVKIYLIDATGLAGDTLDAMIPTLTKVANERGLVPVFVTDLLDFQIFRRHGVIFEALPPLAESTALAPGHDWRVRRAECFALVLGKWQPVGRTVLGPRSD
jgi:hypothetical protein